MHGRDNNNQRYRCSPCSARCGAVRRSSMTRHGMGPMSVGQIISTAAIRFPDRESYICTSTQRRFTFRQTNQRSNRLAHGLLGLGLKKGDRVAFLSSNRAELVETYFALAKCGLVGLPLNYRL